MSEITLIFIGELNDFIQQRAKFTSISHSISFPSSIKDVIESIGVPHPEIDIILANNRSVDFSYQVQHGDEFHIYPYNVHPQTSRIIHLAPQYMDVPTFVVDTHLGKLTSYLRMLGFDTIYQNDYDDQRLAEISSQEDRTLLSRDIGLLKRKVIKRGYYIRSRIPRNQLIETINRYQLVNKMIPFKRCIQCNGLLNPIPKSMIQMQLQDKTRQYYDEFKICDSCSKIYWKGSHYYHMKDFIGQIILQCDEIEN
jgi:uncharacterized protein with PIN domain